MILRNKKTGEIIETDFELSVSVPDDEKLYGNDTYTQIKGYNSIKALSEDWEDVEEPKDYYFIRSESLTVGYSPISNSRSCKNRKQIGNYFETKEEAEKAVEKLKAWKRLKDKGFRFIDHIDRDTGQGMTRYEWDGYVNGEDLDLLFGGEDE